MRRVAKFLRTVGVRHRHKFSRRGYLDRAKSLGTRAFNLGYDSYTSVGERDIYDGFAHPIVHYFDAAMIRDVVESNGLELLRFTVTAQNHQFPQAALRQFSDPWERLYLTDCFLHPADYGLLLASRSASSVELP